MDAGREVSRERLNGRVRKRRMRGKCRKMQCRRRYGGRQEEEEAQVMGEEMRWRGSTKPEGKLKTRHVSVLAALRRQFPLWLIPALCLWLWCRPVCFWVLFHRFIWDQGAKAMLQKDRPAIKPTFQKVTLTGCLTVRWRTGSFLSYWTDPHLHKQCRTWTLEHEH